ncbi:hypothetical protein PIB30_102554 [Stylosanthes scabra]|uniref:DUF4283 domain-containing protein n=1 Tax=Stylosanthes scabra TaxID=79078 RepID=A0ABU6XWX0_9FABA|nr:hypothetical protein [Stylosanthes scabra]
MDVFISRKKRKTSSLPFTFVWFDKKGGAMRAVEMMNEVTTSAKGYAQWGKEYDSGKETEYEKRDAVHEPVVGRDKKIDEAKNMALPYIKGKKKYEEAHGEIERAQSTVAIRCPLRRVWLDIMGVPLQLWDKETFWHRAYEESMCVTAEMHEGNDELGSESQSVVPESEVGEGRAPERAMEEQGSGKENIHDIILVKRSDEEGINVAKYGGVDNLLLIKANGFIKRKRVKQEMLKRRRPKRMKAIRLRVGTK